MNLRSQPRYLLLALTMAWFNGNQASAVTPTKPASTAFMQYWKSGLAEISSYAGLEERYGSMRTHSSVLIFVYEEIDDKTRIKVESDRIPMVRQIPILKLNRLLHFNTGIYDYSVMTSVFAGLSGPGVTRPFLPRKIALTAQEWCGMVFQELLPRERTLDLVWHSYFEAEGEGKRSLKLPKGDVVYEDELPILLRELDGDWMVSGETKTVQLFPAEWRTRKMHKPASFAAAMVHKESGLNYSQANKVFPATSFTVSTPWDTTTWVIENQPPRKVLAWRVSTGAYGELKATTRKSYWLRNKPENQPLRQELGLPISNPPPPQGQWTQSP
jgi:hypothetical protein